MVLHLCWSFLNSCHNVGDFLIVAQLANCSGILLEKPTVATPSRASQNPPHVCQMQFFVKAIELTVQKCPQRLLCWATGATVCCSSTRSPPGATDGADS